MNTEYTTLQKVKKLQDRFTLDYAELKKLMESEQFQIELDQMMEEDHQRALEFMATCYISLDTLLRDLLKHW